MIILGIFSKVPDKIHESWIRIDEVSSDFRVTGLKKTLRSVLEGWLIVKIRHGDKLPVIGGINLNNTMPAFKEMVVHG